MKKFIPVSVVLFAMFLSVSCKKHQVGPPPGIEGHWNLVSDLVIHVVTGSQPDRQNYVGQAGDYFNFGSGGNLSWHEQTTGNDSSSYKLSADNKIDINYFPTADPNYINSTFTFTVTTLTAHTMVLTYGPYPASGTSSLLGETITLSR